LAEAKSTFLHGPTFEDSLTHFLLSQQHGQPTNSFSVLSKASKKNKEVSEPGASHQPLKCKVGFGVGRGCRGKKKVGRLCPNTATFLGRRWSRDHSLALLVRGLQSRLASIPGQRV
jgi:hypothetical protein